MICPYCGYGIYPNEPWATHRANCKHRTRARFELIMSAVSGAGSADFTVGHIAATAVALADQVLEKLETECATTPESGSASRS